MPAKPPRILVVHDQFEMQVYLSNLLESGGFTAITAGNGNEGLQIAMREKPDLIIIEGIMSRTSGDQLYGLLRTESAVRDIPVIVLSSLPLETFIYFQKFCNPSSDIFIPEPEAYLKKPPEREELLDMVSKLIRSDPGRSTDNAGPTKDTFDGS